MPLSRKDVVSNIGESINGLPTWKDDEWPGSTPTHVGIMGGPHAWIDTIRKYFIIHNNIYKTYNYSTL